MDITVTAKYLRSSPRKLRPIAESIRLLPVSQAEERLLITPKKGAKLILKALQTAVADAEHNFKKAKKTLIVQAVNIDEGNRMKRYREVARGTAHRYKRLTAHIKIILRVKE